MACGAQLTLLTVVEAILGVESFPAFPLAVAEDAVKSARADGLAYLESAAAELRKRGLVVDTKVIVKVGVAAAVLSELEREEIDFVAMTTHGATGFQRVLLGSVADKVIRGADKPVLIVRRDP